MATAEHTVGYPVGVVLVGQGGLEAKHGRQANKNSERIIFFIASLHRKASAAACERLPHGGSGSSSQARSLISSPPSALQGGRSRSSALQGGRSRCSRRFRGFPSRY